MAEPLKSSKDLTKVSDALLKDVKSAIEYIRQNYDKNFYAEVSSALRPKDYKSRHSKGNALDIFNFNGYTYNNNKDKFTKWGDIFVEVLKSMGYQSVKSESGVAKAILWKSDPQHNNHVHISNTTTSSSAPPTKGLKLDDLASATQSDATPKTTDMSTTQYQTDPGLSLFKFETKMKLTKKMIMEAILSEGLFGKGEYENKNMIVVPSSSNDYVFFPFDKGKVIGSISTDCPNEIIISFNDDKNKIQYCGANKSYVYRGTKVKKDERIGRVGSDDVTIRILDNRDRLISLKDLKIEEPKDKSADEKPKDNGKEKQTRKYVSATSSKEYEPDLLNYIKKMIGIKAR